MNVDDWKLAPPMSEWRAQVSYIVPFGISTTMAALLAFFIGRNPWFPAYLASPAKYITLFSIVFWFTIGMYQAGDQALGSFSPGNGLGNFNTFPVASRGAAQPFWQELNCVLVG